VIADERAGYHPPVHSRMPRVDPANWRASQDGPASRSNKMPATMPTTRIRTNGVSIDRVLNVGCYRLSPRRDVVGTPGGYARVLDCTKYGANESSFVMAE
jgi:hypothetical protein